MSVGKVNKAKRYLADMMEEFTSRQGMLWHKGGGELTAYHADTYFNSLYFMTERIFKMAGTQKSKANGQPEFKGFVNYKLSDEDKQKFKEWDIDDHDLWLLLMGDIQTGYKLTVTFNKQNDTFNATYMCNDVESPQAGYCLSAFAPDWYTAVKSLCYKHNVTLDCVWPIDGKVLGDNWG